LGRALILLGQFHDGYDWSLCELTDTVSDVLVLEAMAALK
jgi:hypothetical protein